MCLDLSQKYKMGGKNCITVVRRICFFCDRATECITEAATNSCHITQHQMDYSSKITFCGKQYSMTIHLKNGVILQITSLVRIALAYSNNIKWFSNEGNWNWLPCCCCYAGKINPTDPAVHLHKLNIWPLSLLLPNSTVILGRYQLIPINCGICSWSKKYCFQKAQVLICRIYLL